MLRQYADALREEADPESLKAALERWKTDLGEQERIAALARAVVAETSATIRIPQGFSVPKVEDLDGVPGADLGDGRAVLVENGQVVPVRLPEDPLDAGAATVIGLALLTAAATARDTGTRA